MIRALGLSFVLACSGGLFWSSEQLQTQRIEDVDELPSTNAATVRIYFIHNAESEYSAERGHGPKFTSGKSPQVSLTEQGKKQAERVCHMLSSRLKEAVIFIPPAKWAEQTITPLFSDRIVFGACLDGLSEVGMGSSEGKPKDALYESAYQPWKELSAKEKYAAPKVGGGESYEKAAQRALSDLAYIVRENPGKTIVIVSGENLLNALAIHWINPVLSGELGSNLPLLPIEKGDILLVELPKGQSIEEAKVKRLFSIY